MSQTFQKLLSISIEHKWAAFSLICLISIFAAIGHYDENIVLNLLKPPSVETTKTKAPPKRSARPAVDEIRFDRSDAAIVVTSENFFTPLNVRVLREIVTELEKLDQVAGILWMDRMPPLNIFGLSQPLLPRSKAPPGVYEVAREKALGHPLVGGQLLSPDTKTMLMLVTYDWRYNLSNENATTDLKKTAERVTQQYPDSDLQFLITGKLPGQIAALAHQESNSIKFQLIGYGLSLLLAVFLFRGIPAVIVVTAAPVIGVLWTMGFINFLGYNQNGLVIVVVPVLVSLVALTDGVHLLVQIRKLRASGLNRADASRQAVQKVGLACFLTSLTTAVGFGSLVLAESEMVQEFGKSAVIGVCFSFISVVTLIPLLCSTWLGQKIHIGHEQSIVDRNLSKISPLIDAVMKRSRLYSSLGIAGTILLIAISLTLKPDYRISNNLPAKSEVLQAMEHLDTAFRGVEFVDARIRWNPQTPSDSPEVLEVVSKVDDLLASEALIGTRLSIRNLIEALPGDGPPNERMPILELLPPPLKRSFYEPEQREARVQFRVRDLGIAEYGPVFERIETGLDEISQQHPSFDLALKGSAIGRWKNIFQIVEDLFKSLGAASLIIFLVLTAVYRSIKIGLISLVPNLFPLAVSGSFLALAGFNLEIVMVCSFTVCLGIAVDDTIHFLTRYQQERSKTPEQETAIRNAFTGVGTALIMTTVVLVAGFSGVMFSDSRDHQIFAIMGVLTIGTALFCDLVFLPALLKRYIK